MATAADIIRIARSQLGYTEERSNITKFWAELEPGFQGQPWCAAFVSWVFKEAGAPLPNMGKAYGFSYCPYAEQYAKKNGLWDEDGLYQPGDVILYGPGLATHTGIVVSDNGSTVVTIEGNTSSGESGSQTDGGGVYLRHRPHGPWVRGVLATSRLLDKPAASPIPAVFEKPATPAPKPVPAAAPTPVSKPAGGLNVKLIDLRDTSPLVRAPGMKALQRLLGVPADGLGGKQTSDALAAAQRRCGLPADRVFGPQTAEALLAGK